MKKQIEFLIIVFVAIVIFLIGLYHSEIVKIDCRYGLFVYDIKRYGIGIFSTLFGKPYTDYPSTSIILMYLTSFFGNYVNMLTITLPSAIVSALTVGMVYLIGLRYSRQIALYSVLFCFLSYEFVAISRAPSLDIYVALSAILSFYIVYTADEDKNKLRIVWLPLTLVLGFAFRGPIGIVIPSAVVFVYYVVNKNWKMSLIFAIISSVTSIFCVSILVFLAYYTGGKELVQLFLIDQVLNRLEKTRSIVYYFVESSGSYAVTYSLGLFTAVIYLFRTYVKKDKIHNLKFIVSIAAWLLTIPLLMTIPGSKHFRYIIGAIPASALMAAFIFTNPDNFKIFDSAKKILLFVCKIAPFISLLGLIIITPIIKSVFKTVPYNIYAVIISLLILCIIMLLIIKSKDSGKKDFYQLVVMAVVFLLFQIFVIKPIEQYRESSIKFVADVSKIKEPAAKIFFFDFGPDGDDLKFLVNLSYNEQFVGEYIIPGYNENNRLDIQSYCSLKKDNPIIKYIFPLIPENKGIKKTILPKFKCYGLSKLHDLPDNTILITRKKDFGKSFPSDLKSAYTIVVEGQLGHQQCIAFKKRK